MEENKAELTDKEKEEKEKEKRRNLINYFLRKDPVLKSNIEFEIKFKSGVESKRWATNDERLQGAKERRWWKSKDNKILYNQQAHVIIRILSNKDLDMSNKGFRLWYVLAFTEKNIDILKPIVDKNDNLVNHDDSLKIVNVLKEYNESQNQNINIDRLLNYVELYFSQKSNFNGDDDYSSFNEPILNNLYNWYLKELTNPDEINNCCKQFEQIIRNMHQLLIKYFDNTVYKYNLICTICKTNEILNTLKLNILNKNKIDNENNSPKKFLETENELIKTILKAIKLTPTIKI